MSSLADRNLLFGILALQLDFITREQLISGMQAWVLAKEKPLADLLQHAGSLSAEHRAALEAIVAAHVKQHNNDPQQSLAAISSAAEIHDELSQIADPQLDASLPHIAAAAAKYRSLGDVPTQSVGESTSAGTRFRILRPHAQGGLGKVSVARDGELNREVALKEIRPQYADDPGSRSRFMLEAEVTGGLEHPGIVPVYGLGTYPNGRPFYAMRFIRGDSLKEAIALYHDPEHVKTQSAGDRAVELRQLLGRLIDVCQAIQYAHDRGVLHRDLKPGNIMLGKYGETLVVDWGLAKAQGKAEPAKSLEQEPSLAVTNSSSSEPTQMGSVVGTLQYMSPEQAAGRLDLLGPPTDVFALGAILYHILAGKAPYQQTTREELVAAVQKGQFPAPRQLSPRVPKALEAICLKAMAKEPTARYASAAEFVDDLEHWLADEAVSAQHDSWLDRLTRFARRHRAAVLAGGIALVTISLVSIAASLVVNEKWIEANRQKEVAERNLNRLEWSGYARNISQAATAWDEHNVALAAHYLKGCKKEFRGWEYDYLYRIFHQDRMTLQGHDTPVMAVAISPDGKQILSGSYDGTLILWDAVTGKLIRKLEGHSESVRCVAYDPTGERIASAGAGSLFIWDTRTGEVSLKINPESAIVKCLAFSPDGKHVACGKDRPEISIWDAKTGEKTVTIKNVGAAPVFDIAFSPDGTYLASASFGPRLKLWNASSGEEIRTLPSKMLEVNCLAFSPDSKHLVSGGGGGATDLDVWDIESGEMLLGINGHSGSVLGVTYSHDGKMIVSGGMDKMVKIWDAVTGKELGTRQGHSDLIQSVAFCSDGRVVSGGNDNNVIVWLEKVTPNVVVKYRSDIQAVTFSPDGKRFVCTPGSVILRKNDDSLGLSVWDLDKMDNVWSHRGHNDLMTSVHFSPDGTLVFTSGVDGFVRSWEAETGKPVTTFSGHTMSVFGLAVSRDGKFVVSGSGDKTIKLWEAKTGKEIKTFTGHSDIVTRVAFSRDGKQIASGGSVDRTVRVWDVATGKQLRECHGHTDLLKGVVFSADGKRIISAGNDKTIRIWDATSGVLLNTLQGHTDSIMAVDLSPDGRRIISTGMDQTVKIWDAESGQETYTIRGFAEPLTCCAFSPDGKRIIVGGMDYTVRVFNSANPTQKQDP